MTGPRFTLKISLVLLWLAVSIVACTNPTPGVAVTPTTLTPLPLISPAISFTPTPQASPTPVPSFTPVPTLAPLYPALVTVCPSNPSVTVEKLGLEPDTLLLVVPETAEVKWDGLFVITADAPTPQRMPALSQGGLLSPNGQWFIFVRTVEGTDKTIPWIGSIDGEQQWPLTADERLEGGSWLNDETVLLFGLEDIGFMNSVYKTVQVLNPFTLEGQFVENLPRMTNVGIGAKFLHHADRTHLIYQDGYDYRLRDVFAQTDQLVLEWLRDDPADFLDKSVSIVSDGYIVIRVDRPYGLDMSPPMSPEEVVASHSYSQTMRPIIFPSAIMPASAGLLSENIPGVIVSGDAEWFYWFDYQQGVIKDYCFPSDGFFKASLDGKFAAFTRETLPHTLPTQKTTFILNLETGYVSRIDNYAFFGWARVTK